MTIKPEFLDLKRVIASYIKKCPSPNKKFNYDTLTRMNQIKPFINTDKDLNDEYYKLRSQIILSNGGFGMKYVMKYYQGLNEDVPITELFQEAIMGLLEAVDTFNLEKETAFTTYAFFHIKKRIIDFIKHNKLIRAPRDIARNLKHVSEAKDFLLGELTHEATDIEIQKYLKSNKNILLKTDVISNIVQLLNLNSCATEEVFISEYNDQYSFENDDGLFRKMELNILKDLEKLDPEVVNAAKLRFGIERDYPHTPEEIKLLINSSNIKFVL